MNDICNSSIEGEEEVVVVVVIVVVAVCLLFCLFVCCCRCCCVFYVCAIIYVNGLLRILIRRTTYLRLCCCCCFSRVRVGHSQFQFQEREGDREMKSKRETSSSSSALKKLISGGLASAVSKTCFAPFERVKLMIQNRNVLDARSYSNVKDASRRIFKDQGLRSFWRGNGTNLMRIVPTYAMRFTFFDFFRDLVTSEGVPATLNQQMSAGAMSGLTTASVTYPLDLLRTRISTTTSSTVSLSVFRLASQIVEREGGFRALYKGFFVSAIEITPYLAITLGGYEFLKSYLSSKDNEKLGTRKSLLAAWGSGLAGSIACYPMDTVKRQLMLDSNLERYNGRISICVRNMYSQIGIRAFYRGCTLNALKSAPVTAVTYVLNDRIREYL